MSSRAEAVEAKLHALLEAGQVEATGNLSAPSGPGSGLTGRCFLDLLETLYTARHLDLEARALKARDEGYYTIASSGHECNAAVAAALRPTDPAFLHYRSGGFFIERARQVPGHTPIFDILLSLTASSDDPISGGRHKVFGSVPLWIYPQTSTIASHLPKAVGHAICLERAKRLGLPLPFPVDSVVVCSCGDASLNHSTALGALNAALWASYQHLPVPILFVCEDNGLGISVPALKGWVENTWGRRDGLEYFRADGLDLEATYDAARRAVERCRSRRAPTFLHLDVVRLFGHAGTDVELAYRDIDDIKQQEDMDPLLVNSRIALQRRLCTGGQLAALYEECGARVRRASSEAATRPNLDSAESIMEPLAPYSPEAVAAEANRADYEDGRAQQFGDADGLPENSKPRHLAQLLNWSLHDMLAKYPEMLVFGEDVAKRGGVYGVTARLAGNAGGGRVFNTLLDEQSIFGMAIGAAQLGFLPVPEIQYLAYYHNAEDQVRGEAATLQFFSRGQLRNPMVIRVAGWAYQRGFGGHFHNDNSIAALRDVPGVVIAAPGRGGDAVGMMRTAMALAKVDGRIVFYIEPIALYRVRDLYELGDDGWLDAFPAPGTSVELGTARTYEYGTGTPDITIVSWANGLWRSLRAAQELERKHDIKSRVIDLRWLLPLDVDTLRGGAQASGRVLIVDEGRRTGSTSEAIVTALVEEMSGCSGTGLPQIERLCGEDTFIPLGPAWDHVLPNEERIVERAVHMVAESTAAPVESGA